MDIPLFECAMMLLNHKEEMTRIAAYTICLNCFRIKDERFKKALINLPYVYFFPKIALFLRDIVI